MHMTEKLMVIITGAPDTGKTTLSKNLTKKLNLPVINKDEIKDLLFDDLGIKDNEWQLRRLCAHCYSNHEPENHPLILNCIN